MLIPEENERFVHVGAGTPAGEMLRRYWWPIAFSEEIRSDGRPRRVRLLAEDLVLFRDGGGRTGVLGLHCPHRSASLEYGRIEERGIRCAYHGWLYDISGQCLEQPEEPEGRTFEDKIQQRAYVTQEEGGLVFAYLGPQPAPYLPRYDLLCWEGGERILGGNEAHCNWMQEIENTVDQAHLPLLHASVYPMMALKRASYNWERNAYGIKCAMELPGVFTKPRLAYYVFPAHNTMAAARVGLKPHMNFRWRVPIDDTQTTTFWVTIYPEEPPNQRLAGMKTSIPGVYDRVEDDWWHLASHEQDRMAMETQGLITDRSGEHLGDSDRGVMLLREMVRESIEAVEQGRDPIGVIRDIEDDEIIGFDRTLEEMALLSDGAGAAVDPMSRR